MRVGTAVAVLLFLAACSESSLSAPTTVPATTAAVTTRATPTTAGTTTTTIAAPEVESVIDVGGTQLLGLAVTSDAVWPVSYDAGTISRVDPTTNAVTTAYAIPGAASALSVADAVWVASYGGPHSVVAIDATTGAMKASVQAGEVCCDLTSDDEGDVWAIDPGGRVLEISDGGVSKGLPVDIDAAKRAHQRRLRGRQPVGLERHDRDASDRPGLRCDRRRGRRRRRAVRRARGTGLGRVTD